MPRTPAQNIAWNAEDWIGYSHSAIEFIRIGFMAALDRAYEAERKDAITKAARAGRRAQAAHVKAQPAPGFYGVPTYSERYARKGK